MSTTLHPERRAAPSLRSVLRDASLRLAPFLVAALASLQLANAQVPATQVYAGGHHGCVVTPGGGLQCWGRNVEGQLGNGTNIDSAVAVQVSGLAGGVVAVTAGDFFTCALTNAGGVKCWGSNLYGQLGVGGGNRNVPADVPGLSSGVIELQAGEFHTCALTYAGGVKCWGNNFYGEIGDGTNTYTNSPTNVLGLSSGVRAIFSAHRHTCALLVNGGFRCWGANEQGQLGNGTLALNSADGGISTPVNVVALADPVAEVSTARFHTCALTTSGAAMCWGLNDGGELGGGAVFPRSFTAVPVAGLSSGVAHLDSGYTHTCAVLVDGSAKCWGVNDHGQLGNGSTNPSGVASPTAVLGMANGVAQISAAFQHTCVITRGGSVRCVGANSEGGLGNGAPGPDVLTAGPVTGFTASVPATQISPGGLHSCQVDSAGGAWCWGRNVEGQLGNAGSTDSDIPVQVSGLASGVAALASGGGHTCALTTGGAVKCWGVNDHGQLGVTGANRNTPVDVPGLGSGVVALAAGWSHSCALLTGAGGVKCWGDNARGQLGDGTTIGRADPRSVTGITSGVKAITAGDSHSCALFTAGDAMCWGWNQYGQLGNGTLLSNGPNGEIATPVIVGGTGSPIDRLSAGGYHTCAVVGGAAKCWGRGDSGQLGDGTLVGNLLPVNVQGLQAGVADIQAGTTHTCALTAAGAARCWGSNDNGQTGIGTVSPTSATPTGVLGFAAGGVGQIRAGFGHTCVLTVDGWARCWGENASGQLGDSTIQDRDSQAEVMVRAQAIDPFSPPATIQVGVPVTLAATALSGLPTSFDTWPATACAVSGPTLTASKAGLCGVRALQAGSSRFLAAPVQSRVLMVAKGNQSITFGPLGAQPFGVAIAISAAATSGLAVTFSSLTLSVCTVSGNILSTLSTGLCTIAADQPGSADYNAAARVTQAFSIGIGSQTIIFPALADRLLTDPPFGIAASASSGLPVVFSSLTPAACSVAGTTVAIVGMGTCTIAANQSGNSNYDPAPQVTRSFAISNPVDLPRLANVSTRMQVLTGDNVMIGGFVIAGSGSKTVAIVTVGPSLAAAGITNPLANPTLTLVRSSDQAIIATNDDWQTDANASQLQSHGFAPSNPHEAALYMNLPPGAYTAIVAGAGGGTGVGMIGVYEVDHPEVALINISTRGQVLRGNDVMIAGFVIQGSGAKQVAITVVGPSLVAAGITNPLANPTLTLVRSSDQAIVATNDDWLSDPNASQLSASGFAPSNSLEPAVLVTLNPGAYTVIVSGVGGGTGVGIVGVYATP